MNDKAYGQVTIAPEVLVTIVQLTTQDIPGVHQLTANWARGVNRFFGNTGVGAGVHVDVHEHQISIDLYVIVEHSVSMLQLARQIQTQVARAVEEMTGMGIKAVNVHITDVHYPAKS